MKDYFKKPAFLTVRFFTVCPAGERRNAEEIN